ncbi:hypothetical protein [Pseudovibrio sp. SCP19]|uniref:hypothetical protein n=1 Tax=Pseudovibrio sp. SCP19 TaxID=3141374 RepID=UPI003336B8FF
MAELFYIFAFNGYLAAHGILTLHVWHLALVSLIATPLVINEAISPKQLLGIAGVQITILALMSIASGGYQGMFWIPALYFKFSYLANLTLTLAFILICILFLFKIPQNSSSKFGQVAQVAVPILFATFNPILAVIASSIASNAAEYTTTMTKSMSAAGAFFVAFGILVVLPSTAGLVVSYLKADPLKKLLTICCLLAGVISLYFSVLKNIEYFGVSSTVTLNFFEYYIAIDLSKLL